MTDEEFRTWDRHKAENLQAQRDDAIARVDKCDAEKAELLAAKKAEIDKAANEFATTINALDAQIADLTKTVAERDSQLATLITIHMERS